MNDWIQQLPVIVGLKGILTICLQELCHLLLSLQLTLWFNSTPIATSNYVLLFQSVSRVVDDLAKYLHNNIPNNNQQYYRLG